MQPLRSRASRTTTRFGSSPRRVRIVPAAWHLLDRRTGAITYLFSARPKLDKVTLAPMHGVVIKARDGLELVSYLTLPATETGTRPARPLPMVLDVHGGPWWRDGWHYNRDVQWLANRDYAVLQVNYRGSTGFGKAFTNAGDREWAGKMHDDLIDAVNWAVAEGIADPKRIAICGASYGGYAAFVGATFTPDVFCCSVPIVGITNLETMLANPPPYWASFYEQECHRIGDPRTPRGLGAAQGAFAAAPGRRHHQAHADRPRRQRCALQGGRERPDRCGDDRTAHSRDLCRLSRRGTWLRAARERYCLQGDHGDVSRAPSRWARGSRRR